jgi:alpha-1,6-mannosyltransferase
MRIVEISEFYSPNGGGVRTYVDRKFEAAAAAGHEFYVIAPGPKDDFEPRGSGGVYTLRAPALPLDPNYWMFWDAAPVHARLDALGPDLVEASSPWRGAWIAASWTGDAARALFVHAEPVAVYPQRWLAGWFTRRRIDRLFGPYWGYMRRLAAKFDVVVAGAWLAARLAGQGVGSVAPVDLGVDCTTFSPARRDEALRARLLAACGLPLDARLLLGVGRLHPQKRWPMVIEAVASAQDQGPLGLVIVGDGMARPGVAAAAAGKPWVHLAGAIRERTALAAMMASADALVHGCESETYGLVTGEAAASGLPLVLPDWGGSTGFAKPSTSEVYPSGSAIGLAAAIRRLAAREPQSLRSAAVCAASGVRSDEEHYAALFDTYQRLVGGQGAGLGA